MIARSRMDAWPANCRTTMIDVSATTQPQSGCSNVCLAAQVYALPTMAGVNDLFVTTLSTHKLAS